MPKLANINRDKLIKQMVDGDRDAILAAACSDLPILNLNAVLYGTKYKMMEASFVSALKDRFANSTETFFGIEMRSFAIAALDVLNIKKYKGNDPTIIRLIETEFKI